MWRPAINKIPDKDRWRYIRFDDGKLDHGPKAGPDSFRKVSISLPNGEEAPALRPSHSLIAKPIGNGRRRSLLFWSGWPKRTSKAKGSR